MASDAVVKINQGVNQLMRILDNQVVQRGAKVLLLGCMVLSVEAAVYSLRTVSPPVHAQAAPPQDDLPEGPNKSLVVAKCTRCHSAQIFATHRQSSSAWDETISKMQTKGLVLSDEEYDKVLTYLSTYLGPPPATIDDYLFRSGDTLPTEPEPTDLKRWFQTIQ